MSEIANCEHSKTIICLEENCIILKLKEQLLAKEQECKELKEKIKKILKNQQIRYKKFCKKIKRSETKFLDIKLRYMVLKKTQFKTEEKLEQYRQFVQAPIIEFEEKEEKENIAMCRYSEYRFDLKAPDREYLHLELVQRIADYMQSQRSYVISVAKKKFAEMIAEKMVFVEKPHE